ncbi:MAG TPA: type IV toxin-antitoxin system AbiEi family antitoxin domain-containing protein [Solirubrobacteraceae bacterium]|nr:type IV toxin-antitoxin system AbiEi family antitoxin domain-containing protein [Solirubrobacteraceae bacterium]
MREPCRVSPGNRGLFDIVRALGAEQDGVVRRTQLLSRGIERKAIDRALRSGTLHRLNRGVYSSIPPELLGEDALLLNALFAAGPGAFLSHGTAAWRWQIIAAQPIAAEVGTPRDRGVLRPGDVVHNGRFLSTSVTRTLLDLAAHYTQPALRRALAEAEFQHDIRPDDIMRTLRRGHPGSANLRAALDAHAPGHGQAKSRLERRFRALLTRHRVELPLRNQPLGPYVVDCIWPDRRVVVELDGRQHARPHQADADDDRDLWLRHHRFVPRRYGIKQVDRHHDAVIADLLAAFADAVALGYAKWRPIARTACTREARYRPRSASSG